MRSTEASRILAVGGNGLQKLIISGLGEVPVPMGDVLADALVFMYQQICVLGAYTTRVLVLAHASMRYRRIVLPRPRVGRHLQGIIRQYAFCKRKSKADVDGLVPHNIWLYDRQLKKKHL